MKSTEQILKKHWESNISNQPYDEMFEGSKMSIINAMEEYAKQMCISQKEIILGNCSISCECDPFGYCGGEINKDSILNAEMPKFK